MEVKEADFQKIVINLAKDAWLAGASSVAIYEQARHLGYT
jgi:hypothetical protein